MTSLEQTSKTQVSRKQKNGTSKRYKQDTKPIHLINHMSSAMALAAISSAPSTVARTKPISASSVTKPRTSNLRDLSEFTDDDISSIIDQVLDKLLMPIHTKARSPKATVTNDGSKQKHFLPSKIPTIDVSIEEIHIICKKVTEVFRSQPLFIKLRNRVEYFDEKDSNHNADQVITTYIGGDIHGNFKELLRLFDNLGGLSSIFYPGSRKRIVLLGDNVDNGIQSMEVVLLLYCLKIKYPKNIYLLRGSHECGSICRIYGFYDEVKRRYNLRIFKWFVDVFNTMPVQLLLVEEKILCTPSGLSPYASDLEELEVMLCENPHIVKMSNELAQLLAKQSELKNESSKNDDDDDTSTSSSCSAEKEETTYQKFLREKLKRPTKFSSEKKENIFTRDNMKSEILTRPFDVPDESLITDLLWAVPADWYEQGWQENTRGVSYRYSADIVEKFLEDSTYSIDDGDDEMLRKYYPERLASHQLLDEKKEKERRIEQIVRKAFVDPSDKFCNYYNEAADGKVVSVHSTAEYTDSEIHNSGTVMKVTFCEKGFGDKNDECSSDLPHQNDSCSSSGDDDEQRKKWKKTVKIDFEIVLPRKYKERVF